MTYILEAIDVCKTFGDTPAADHVHLQIPENTIYGLLGPNGAGKTTLIRMATTISRPDSGTILFKGHQLTEDHARKMGYMPEERGLYKKMTVLDQLIFFAEIKGMKKSHAKEQAVYWLNRLDMGTWVNKKLEELSKGMAQKVQFLCTIIHQPEFIILDEPFSGFDPVNADLIKDLILELKQNGATILFSTHRMDNVEELCEHICIINHGKVVLNGNSGTMRRDMFKNNYKVGFLNKTSFSNANFQPIQEEILPDGRVIYTFHASDSQRDLLLQACVEKGGMVLFAEDLPTIHQIFVETVTS